MKFGAILSPHWPARQTQLEVYGDLIDQMVYAEELGLYSAWTTEHHFGTDPSYHPFGLETPFPAYDLTPDPLTFLAYVAARTSRIRLGTGVLVVHYDDPLRIAERAAMVDLLSHGRLDLGLGRGGGYREPVAFDVPRDADANQDKYFDALDIMRQAWTGKPFSHKGKYFDLPELSVVPKPLQAQLPVFLSNRNKRSIAYAAEHGMSYMAVSGSWGASAIPGHNEHHELFEETCRAHGHSAVGLDFPQTLFTYIAPTDSEAEEVAEAHMMAFRGYSEAHYETRRAHGDAPPLVNPAAAGTVDPRPQFQLQLETNMIGSPRTVAEKLAALREKMPSLDYVLAIIAAGSPPATFVRRSMHLLATEVMPKFSTPGAGAA